MNPATSPTADSSAPAATPPTSIRWRILLLLMALCFVSHFNRASMTSAGDERLMKTFHSATTDMGWVYSAFLIVYTLCMIPGGLFIDRFGPRAALVVMGFLLSLGMRAFPKAPSGRRSWKRAARAEAPPPPS